jgi:hypothetical protein
MIVPSDRVAPGTVRSLTLDRDLFVVGTRLQTTARLSGYLIFGVNDVYLDRQECDPEGFQSGREAGVFYRDNIGFFTVRLVVDSRPNEKRSATRPEPQPHLARYRSSARLNASPSAASPARMAPANASTASASSLLPTLR